MRQIYVTHSTNFDYQNELYLPIKNSSLNKDYTFIFPHESGAFVNSKAIIKNSQLVIAEVSYPSTGQGIELGWANSYGKPIICLYKKGGKFSKSLKAITDKIFSYDNEKELIEKLESCLSQDLTI